MTKDEALDLALEALESYKSFIEDAHILEGQWHWIDGADKAITAIKQALAQPVQEPVWCGHCNGSGRMVRDPDIGTDQECFVCDGAGVPAAPVQEPVGKIESSDFGNCVQFFSGKMPPVGSWLYTTPPAAQRPFVGLTDEERDHIWHVIGNSDAHGDVDGLSGRDVMAAIEAKLRSKNNENTD